MNADPAKNLVFGGHEPGVIPWTLLGFTFVSACLHAFGFYIFQTVYPPAAHVGPPPVQIGLLTPGAPGADAILRWIDSEDPALAAEPGKAPIPGLMSLPYIPSYSAAVHARPVMASTTEQPLPYPAGVSGLDLVKMAAPHPAGPPPPIPGAATTISFSGALKDSVVYPLPSLDSLHEPDPGVQLQPAHFLIGVSDRGEVRYVFLQDLQDPSGDKTLDAAAGRVLEQVRFRPSSEPLTWGFATVYWGSAVYARPTPAPEASP